VSTCPDESCAIPLPRIDLQQWKNRALFLAWFTVSFNLLEGGVSVAFGLAEDSVALWGFGFDSFVEVASAVVVLWRLRGALEAQALQKERRATLVIGTLFLLLAAAVMAGSAFQLLARHRPDSSLPGVIVSLVSLAVMIWLWRAKLAAAKALDSSTLRGDAACSLACIQLSAVLLAGSLVSMLLPVLWMADGVAACLLALLIAKEGFEMVRAARKADFKGGCGCHD
jgi:divalent metal cation (Fe/Co/Zn/Cd) transporter